jgi:hypothetical protein
VVREPRRIRDARCLERPQDRPLELAAAQRADDRAALAAHGQRQAMKMLGLVALFLVPPLLVIFLYPVVVLVHSF